MTTEKQDDFEKSNDILDRIFLESRYTTKSLEHNAEDFQNFNYGYKDKLFKEEDSSFSYLPQVYLEIKGK